MDQHIERMREGLKRGITVPKATMAGVETSITPLASGAPEAHAVYEPFAHFPATFADADRTRLAARAKDIVATQVIPTYRKFLDFMQETYVPGCRETIAATALPDGEAFYRFQIRSFTSLGIEAGFYTDPYSDFGRLGYESWRASRLVVDTGIHSFGWSRQQAIDYLAANTSLPVHEATTETDRYISWPVQALSYYIGYLKIRELRAQAEKDLGGRFDRRSFHDEVLRHGSVPLPVLERLIHDWIGARPTAG